MNTETNHDLSYRISKMRSEIRNKIVEDNEILHIMQLINRLELQTFVCSSPNAACYYPEYKQLVKMGKKLIPLIYEFMKDDNTVHWWMFALLSEITGQDVVTSRIQGKIAPMRKAWLKWIRTNYKETFDMLPIADVSPPQKLATLFEAPQTLIAYTEAATAQVVKMFEDLSRQAKASNTAISIPLNNENCPSADAFIEFITAISTTGTPYRYFLFSGFEHILDNFSLKDAVRCIEFIMNECACKVVVAGVFNEDHASLYKKLMYFTHTAYSMYTDQQIYAHDVDYVFPEYALRCSIQKKGYAINKHYAKEPATVVL